MITDTNKMAASPDAIPASIEFSYFSSEFSCDAFRYHEDTEILACLNDSMIFKSHAAIPRGATIYMTVSHLRPRASDHLRGEEIAIRRVAEVKDCRKLPDSDRYAFEIGVKFMEPCY